MTIRPKIVILDGIQGLVNWTVELLGGHFQRIFLFYMKIAYFSSSYIYSIPNTWTQNTKSFSTYDTKLDVWYLSPPINVQYISQYSVVKILNALQASCFNDRPFSWTLTIP
jgi:hypothetical protein